MMLTVRGGWRIILAVEQFDFLTSEGNMKLMKLFIGSQEYTPKSFFTRRNDNGQATITVVTLDEGGAVVFFPGTDRIDLVTIEAARDAWAKAG